MDTPHISKTNLIAFENQRWFPLVGWSSKLLPTDVYGFSGADGTIELNMSDYIDNNNPWEYAVNFQSEFFPCCGLFSCVRRKQWDKILSNDNDESSQSIVMVDNINDIASDLVNNVVSDIISNAINIINHPDIPETINTDHNTVPENNCNSVKKTTNISNNAQKKKKRNKKNKPKT